MNLVTEQATLETLLATIPGLEVYPRVPDKPNVPCAVVVIEPFEPHASLGGATDLHFAIQVLVQWSDWDAAQTALAGYMSTGSTGSIIDAVEAAGGEYSIDRVEHPATIQVDGGDARFGSVTFHGTKLL